jgi:sialate O-acetylesterase
MRLSILICTLFVSFTSLAEVAVPAIISDKMILQANGPAPLWGTAAPDEEISVEINGQKKSVTAGKDGKWLVKLEGLKPGGPFELKISGKNALTIKDVLVGEVWLASGQSNMKYALSKTSDAAAEIPKANFPQIRYFLVQGNGGRWVETSPKTAPAFSAVAYHFAATLHQKLNTPVGIIENAVNGAVAQAFISKAALEADPALAEAVKAHKHEQTNHELFEKSFLPIIPYGIKGALWYQGEGNRDFPVTYQKLLPALIADWRKHWAQGDFPFLIVQLANYQAKKPEIWEGKDCALREAQFKSLSVPNTALAVTIDLGIVGDVHYPNKKPVGQRLAIAAAGLAYGEKIEYQGPLFAGAKFEGNKAVVSFTHVGGGLIAKGGDKLLGFQLCGENKKFVRADAKIEADTVVVTSDKVPSPVAVRYAWERNPDCNLYNKEDLPASPFRSDSFVTYFTKDGAD